MVSQIPNPKFQFRYIFFNQSGYFDNKKATNKQARLVMFYSRKDFER